MNQTRTFFLSASCIAALLALVMLAGCNAPAGGAPASDTGSSGGNARFTPTACNTVFQQYRALVTTGPGENHEGRLLRFGLTHPEMDPDLAAKCCDVVNDEPFCQDLNAPGHA